MLKKKIILKLSLTFLLSAAMVTLAWLGTYFLKKQILNISQKIQEKKQLTYILKNRENAAAKINRDFKLVAADYEQRIKNGLPTVDNIIPFVEAMESLAKKNSLNQTITFASPQPLPADSGDLTLFAINYTLSLSNANLSVFLNYLEDFEKLPYFASLDSISLGANGSRGWEDNSSITLSGKFYAKE